MTTVVGIDLSLTGTGVAVGDQLHTVHSSSDGTSLLRRHDRLVEIIAAIWELIPANRHLVVVESPSLGQARQGGTLDRNGLWWLLVDFLTRQGIPVVDVTPATLKKFATGKGTATKPDMRMALFRRAGLDVRDDNQVDAWWLHQIGLHLLAAEPRLSLPKDQLAALGKINWPAIV